MAVYKIAHCPQCKAQRRFDKPPKAAPQCKCGSAMAVADRWTVAVSLPLDTGGMRRVTEATTTHKAEAIVRERELLSLRDKGEAVIHTGRKRGEMTIGECADAFLSLCAEREREGRLASKTVAFYRERFKNGILPYFGASTPITQINRSAIVGLKRSMRDKAKAATIRGTLAALSSMFAALIKDEQLTLETNPVTLVERPEADEPIGKALTEAEVTSLLTACKAAKREALYLIVLIAVNTGLRRNTITRLTWDMIDFQRNQIVTKTKGGKVVMPPLSDKLRAELLAWKQNQGKLASIGNWVFPSPRNHAEPMHPEANFGLDNARDRAGIDCRFHDLRHTFITHFLQRTGDLHGCAHIVGHSSTYMTEHYGHLLDEHRHKLMAKFGGM